MTVAVLEHIQRKEERFAVNAEERSTAEEGLENVAPVMGISGSDHCRRKECVCFKVLVYTWHKSNLYSCAVYGIRTNFN